MKFIKENYFKFSVVHCFKWAISIYVLFLVVIFTTGYRDWWDLAIKMFGVFLLWRVAQELLEAFYGKSIRNRINQD